MTQAQEQGAQGAQGGSAKGGGGEGMAQAGGGGEVCVQGEGEEKGAWHICQVWHPTNHVCTEGHHLDIKRQCGLLAAQVQEASREERADAAHA